jgi:cytochrome oxidase Cu insertion factor (SCO1/SenC/PrrC family)
MTTRILAIATVALLGASVSAWAHSSGKGIVVQEEHSVRSAQEDGYAVKPPAPESLGGEYELKDTAGASVTSETFKGKWVLIYFGYPSCREACPTGLENMTQALMQLGAEADAVQPLFVDFSMEKPDPKGVAQFVSNFHPKLKGLVGSRAQIFTMLRLYKVRRDYGNEFYSTKETGPRIDHTTYFYLVDPSGVTRTYFYHTLTPEKMAAAIREQMAHPQTDAGIRQPAVK